MQVSELQTQITNLKKLPNYLIITFLYHPIQNRAPQISLVQNKWILQRLFLPKKKHTLFLCEDCFAAHNANFLNFPICRFLLLLE
jgi:hypothetical protein